MLIIKCTLNERSGFGTKFDLFGNFYTKRKDEINCISIRLENVKSFDKFDRK